MAKADRLARLDVRRLELEGDYRAALMAALRRAAAGTLGLFDRQGDKRVRAAIAPTIDALAELGAEIDGMRDQLGLPPFALQQDFLAARGPAGAQAVGERRQAQGWLDRLAGEGEASA